jgi:hypothetical protein
MRLVGVLSLFVIASVVAGAGAFGAVPSNSTRVPLTIEGETRSRIDQALMELSRGNASYFETLTATDFLQPSARPSAHAEDVYMRWTHLIPHILQRLTPEQKQLILSRLDAHYVTLRATQTDNPIALACAFIPAPTALREVQQAANRAFDQGQFAGFLGLAYFIPDTVPALDERRLIAEQVSGWSAQANPDWQLTAPGLPQPTDLRPTPTPAITLGVRWETTPGWLFALDPFGHIIWQYRIDRTATVFMGPSVVLVRDSSGTRLIDAHAVIRPLPPLPSGARTLALGATAGWFATDNRVWRFALADGTISELLFTEPPIAAPLLRGDHSLWLTEHELLFVTHDRITKRLRHQLAVDNAWFLAYHDTRALMVNDEGARWLIPSLQEQTAQKNSREAIAALLAAQAFDEIIQATQSASDPQIRSLRCRAQIGLALQTNDEQTLHALQPVTDEDQALLFSAQLMLSDPQKNYRLNPHAISPATRAVLERLDIFCAKNPSSLLTSDRANVLDPSTRWTHVMHAPAWTAWRTHLKDIATRMPQRPALQPQPRIMATAPATTERNEQGDLVVPQGIIQLRRSHNLITITLSDAEHQPRWQQNWRSRAFITVPSVSVDVHDGYIFIYEIGARLTVIDAALGLVAGQYELREVNGVPYFIAPNTLAIIGPLGVQDTITWIHQDNAREDVREEILDHPARWAMVFPPEYGRDSGLILCDNTKKIWRYPGRNLLPWAAPLTTLPTAPVITPAGIIHDNHLWEWAR